MNATETASEVAKFMPGWRVEPWPDGSVSVARIVRDIDNASVDMYLAGNRTEINAVWPVYADGSRYRPDKHLKITVGAKRAPEAVATEIERRLLSEYLPAYAQALSSIKDREAEQAATQSCAERLGAIVSAEVLPNGRGGFGLYETYECIAKTHVRSGGRVTMELSDLDEVTAARVLTLLKQREEAIERSEPSATGEEV